MQQGDLEASDIQVSPQADNLARLVGTIPGPIGTRGIFQIDITLPGGQAKTLMFVHINPESDSYSQTVATLKFAERVAGIELGAARCKDDREAREQAPLLVSRSLVSVGAPKSRTYKSPALQALSTCETEHGGGSISESKRVSVVNLPKEPQVSHLMEDGIMTSRTSEAIANTETEMIPTGDSANGDIISGRTTDGGFENDRGLIDLHRNSEG